MFDLFSPILCISRTKIHGLEINLQPNDIIGYFKISQYFEDPPGEDFFPSPPGCAVSGLDIEGQQFLVQFGYLRCQWGVEGKLLAGDIEPVFFARLIKGIAGQVGFAVAGVA